MAPNSPCSVATTSPRLAPGVSTTRFGPDRIADVGGRPLDPGIVNWLDTVGRTNGVLFMRNYHASEDRR